MIYADVFIPMMEVLLRDFPWFDKYSNVNLHSSNIVPKPFLPPFLWDFSAVEDE